MAVLYAQNRVVDLNPAAQHLIGEHIELMTLPTQDLTSVRVGPGQKAHLFEPFFTTKEHESKSFAIEERYSLTDQIRRSSRSVCTNLAEAWRKRRYLEEMIGVNL